MVRISRKKKLKLHALVFLLIVLTGFSAAAGIYFWNGREFCAMDSTFECFDAVAGNDGFLISLANTGSKDIMIEDIIISKRDGNACNQPRRVFSGPDKVRGHSTITYLVSKEHPDGICLLDGLGDGKKIDYEIEMIYLASEMKHTAKGIGRARIVDENVSFI